METITITDNDLKVFFECCNKTEPSKKGGSPLVEPPPRPSAEYDSYHNRLKDLAHLDIQEICITYKPAHHKKNPTKLHRETKKFIQKFMKEHDYFKPTYIFIPEFNKAGILHYHGIIYFDNANDFWTAELKRRLNQRYGRTEGKKVHDLTNYWTYMTKDIHKQKFTIKPFTNIIIDTKAGQPADN